MPAVNAPTNAAAAGGNETRSTSSNLRVFASAPITAAEAASLTGLLNITENPKTPQKLAASLNSMNCHKVRCRGKKSIGVRCRISAINHAVIVATIIMMRA